MSPSMKVGGFACQRADAAQRFGGAVDEVVEDDDVMPCLQEDEDGVRADVAGAAGDENHGSLLFVMGLMFWNLCFGNGVPLFVVSLYFSAFA